MDAFRDRSQVSTYLFLGCKLKIKKSNVGDLRGK